MRLRSAGFKGGEKSLSELSEPPPSANCLCCLPWARVTVVSSSFRYSALFFFPLKQDLSEMSKIAQKTLARSLE